MTDGTHTLNNIGHMGNLAHGTDFAQTVVYEPADLPHGVQFRWQCGLKTAGSCLSVQDAGLVALARWRVNGSAGRISALRDFDLTYGVAIFGPTDHFNVAHFLWLTDGPDARPQSITTELMIWVHPGNFT